LSALFIFLLVAVMAFSTFCQFLQFWFQSNDSETKAIVNVFICHAHAHRVLYEVHFWKGRLAAEK